MAATTIPRDAQRGYSDTDSEAEGSWKPAVHKILRSGRVEQNGIQPLALEERTSTRFLNIFTIWCSMNCNILGVTFGMLGPIAYGLSLRDSALIILFFNLLAVALPAYFATFGPKTGMRQMVQARYSFGRYLVFVPVLCNLATLIGFTVIICIVGGQCISAVSDGRINANVGIVIIAVLSLIVSFWGYKVLHVYETYAFIVAIITISIAAGYAGEGLQKQHQPAPVATVAGVMSFGMIVASYQIPWAVVASDMTTYFDPKIPSWRIFGYTYFGLLTPTVLLMTLGAALAGAIDQNPTWQQGYNKYLVGGVLAGCLSPAGNFGKFVLVLLALTLLGNTCATFYAITLNFQTLIPFLAKVPRYIFSIVSTGIVITVSILAVDNFFESLENVVSLIGYWSASFVGIILSEHLIFRRSYSAYNPDDWNSSEKLPPGWAALTTGVVAIAAAVPMMDQIYWRGPVAKYTGDLGFELTLILSFVLYFPFRYIERRVSGR